MKRSNQAVAAAVAMILAAVGAVEGGYVNNPFDPGGETNHGVTVSVARKAGYAGPMKALPRKCDRASVCAESIFVTNYIEKPGFLPIIGEDKVIGEELIDSAVNFGPARPSRWLQEAVNNLSGSKLTVDGKVGPATVEALAAYRKRRGDKNACITILRLLDAQQAVEYIQLRKVNPRLGEFSYGWISTRVENVNRKRCGEAYGEG